MLRSFRFSNHRSFRDEQEFLLVPAYDKGSPAVPVAAVFGANAAGKSNLLDGMGFMADAVRNSYRSWPPGAGVPRRPFRLAGSAGSSVYVVDAEIDGRRHTYGFSVTDEQVEEEWLYTYPHNRRRTVFERTGHAVTLGSTLTGQKSKTEILAELTRPNALFLSLAAQVGMAEVQPVYRWFTESLTFSVGPASEQSLTAAVLAFLADRPRNQARLLDLLKAADLGIVDLVVDERHGELFDAAFEAWRRQQAEVGIERARANGVSEDVLHAARKLITSQEGSPLSQESATDQRLRLVHGDEGVEFDLHEESAGTRAWLWMLPAALRALDAGSPLLIDEIDSSLHPELTARLIRLFQSGELNPRGAQLIFTTHDATLLGTTFGDDLLSRDQVWFVEKDNDGASRLYPLTDFHPRKGENRERRYLAGSYGAIPVTSDQAIQRAVQDNREAG